MPLKKAMRNAIMGKSKTINTNLAAMPIAPILIMAARHYGWQMTPEEAAAVTAAVLGAANFCLRLLTDTALADKGES